MPIPPSPCVPRAQHYPTVNDVETYLGDMETGRAYRAIHKCLYKLLPEKLPKDIDNALEDGNRFEHPDPPYYHQTKAEQIAAADRHQLRNFTPTTPQSRRRLGSTFYQENEYNMR